MLLPSAEQLASAFLEELRVELRPEQLSLIFERNAVESDQLICHSHDFCDANQCMLDAFVACGCDVDFEPLDESLCALIEAAWRLALPHDSSRHSHVEYSHV